LLLIAFQYSNRDGLYNRMFVRFCAKTPDFTRQIRCRSGAFCPLEWRLLPKALFQGNLLLMMMFSIGIRPGPHGHPGTFWVWSDS